jgi:ribosomal-protein-alanine N-acetyltransferase
MGSGVKLEGAHCSVRPWRPKDLDALVRHANNINVARHLRDRFPHPYTRSDAKGFIDHVRTTPPQMNFAIDAGGEAVGGIGFVPGTDIERYSAEIGYWLGETFWGRGIVTEALLLVTDYAFTRVNLLRLFALPFADNAGSVRVLEKAGYAREGLLRQSSVKFGQPRDQLIYARINAKWKQPGAPVTESAHRSPALEQPR